MRKEIILTNLTFITLLGCSVATNSEIKTTINPSSSVEVSTIPTYSPTPLAIVEDKSLDPNFHCVNAYFKDNIDDEINNPRIDKPYDLAVSNDGKNVYVTKYKDVSDCKTREGNELKTYIDREFIYKIRDSKVETLKLDNNYEYSKKLNHHIEIDKDNNLYVIKTDINKEPPSYGAFNISNQELFKITNERDISKVISLKKEENNGYNYSINQLNVSKFDNNITYSQIPFRLELKKTANKINENGSFDTLYNYHGYGSSGVLPFIFEDNKMNFGGGYIQEPFPYIFDYQNPQKNIYSLIPIGTGIQVLSLKMNSKKEVFILGGYYEESKRYHGIYKIIPNKGVEVFAGGKEAGYRDGLGGTAMFNNPSSIDFDANDNMYVADTGNNAIRKITPNGDVTTFFKQE